MNSGPARGDFSAMTRASILQSRVAGDRKNLNPYEAHAVGRLGHCGDASRASNRLYDYTKLKAGKLHPGIAVCTFLAQDSNVADFDWKFDLGGIYHYVGHTRKDAFSLVRRYKTIWPDRPVLWLSHGIGVYERTPIQYTVPDADRASIIDRTYRKRLHRLGDRMDGGRGHGVVQHLGVSSHEAEGRGAAEC